MELGGGGGGRGARGGGEDNCYAYIIWPFPQIIGIATHVFINIITQPTYLLLSYLMTPVIRYMYLMLFFSFFFLALIN
jgi:hypothetical protein